ncbi:nucleotide-sugar transporter family protein [Actinidia rufa]|uniref:Nucleotide-sugar transporter family protein n=1 Tax=Actinidia rufa TaxID=165716 RepID=A0A7J0EQD8_9ERIC|nr:nucleotide-sugar transporter family protein [Actinidia rufa]
MLFLLVEKAKEANPIGNANANHQPTLPQHTNYTWWLRMAIYALLVLSGQSIATLLGRLYCDKGGNSKWMATLVQPSGFPILIPFLFLSLPKNQITSNDHINTPSASLRTLVALSLSLVGLIFEISSLFSNVISALGFPIVPVLAVFVFNDNMDGVKVIDMLLAIWGFISYIYQHYLDDLKSKSMQNDRINGAPEVSLVERG